MDARPRLTPAMADTRRAVRASLAGLPESALVLVALSGGRDSLALAAAAAFEGPRAGFRIGAVIVDHGLQEGSAAVADRAAEQAAALGLLPVVIERVTVGSDGGPEASARTARYAALDDVAERTDAVAVLLAHTRDDQAETVLLGLARGAGAASLAGMAPAVGRYRRPFLGLSRVTTGAACVDLGLRFWDDPHNLDPSFARVRVRNAVLPVLEAELGPGIAEALARTAEQLREDAETLDALVEETLEEIVEHAEAGIAVSTQALAANPPALRQRIIRRVAAAEFGAALTRAHTLEVARLITDWHGQGALDLPGITVERVGRRLVFTAADTAHNP